MVKVSRIQTSCNKALLVPCHFQAQTNWNLKSVSKRSVILHEAISEAAPPSRSGSPCRRRVHCHFLDRWCSFRTPDYRRSSRRAWGQTHLGTTFTARGTSSVLWLGWWSTAMVKNLRIFLKTLLRYIVHKNGTENLKPYFLWLRLLRRHKS